MNMKKIFSILLTAAVSVFVFSSCVKDDEELFEKSASVRLSEALTTAQKVLTGASNGWAMYYYPDPDQSYGGYMYTMKFTDTEVTVASELFDEAYTSLYKMTTDNGPVLSFDTNNYAFHYFATPSGSSRNLYGESGLYQAYKGDFEFMILSATADEVVLKGKRTGNTIKMVPLSGDMQAYAKDVAAMAEAVFVSTFNGTIGSDEAEVYLDLSSRWAYIELKGEKYADAEDGSAESAYMFTEKGIKLYKPVTVGPYEIDELVWDGDKQSLVSPSGSAVAVNLVGSLPEGWHPYNDFLGKWSLLCFDGAYTHKGVEIVEDIKGKSYLIKGLSDQFDVKATYNLGSGQISINVQTVGNNGTYDVLMCAWDSNAGYITWNTAIGMSGKFVAPSEGAEEDGSTIQWSDNGVWGSYTVDAFYLFFFQGSTRISASSAPWVFNQTFRPKNQYYIWGWQKMIRE